MVKYPIKKTQTNQTRTSVANRGMDLEEAINQTNQFYIDNDVAYIYKKPIPIQVVKVDYERRSAAKISEAYYKVPSTTDYNGLYKGRYIDFEAKETRTKTSFPLKNIHPHQVIHLHNVIRHGGIGFVIVHFTLLGRSFLLDASYLVDFYERGKTGRKSIELSEFETYGHELKEAYVKRLDYLSIVDQVYFK
ncbi:MAG: Holliday junction resolvase RecU [Candidatus Izemoplasmatales bacterium]|jgi:recombination protein U|nr:Holliday junction resolvase RecU [Candidatus Izemoplasmatales bacterium]NLF48274.1 Holliday junction resolvase RecU [Acholeplasmataceae bacterium]MDD4355506.1 Holliday junction resolvase RecU [Candidatus Izemoplasmatales bacterium]MDD4987565.1 Holliday junction resolvase RecU [Candidatus Izemoplasmatales bacterium]MDD5602100.1 Holliday junction resolvase RecU [Candidatus Izemoplasmatales bacterium]